MSDLPKRVTHRRGRPSRGLPVGEEDDPGGRQGPPHRGAGRHRAQAHRLRLLRQSQARADHGRRRGGGAGDPAASPASNTAPCGSTSRASSAPCAGRCTSMAACGSPPRTPSRSKNIGKSVPDAMVEQRMSLKTFKDRGMPVEWGIILGAFGCNYEGELVDRADPAARAAGARRGRAGRLQAQGHQAHRRHGLGDAALGRSPDRRHPHQVARARDRRCTCTTRAAPAWRPPMPACSSASPSSTPRSRAWAAARSPRPTARPATSAPRTSPSCARRWASRPASTSTS